MSEFTPPQSITAVSKKRNWALHHLAIKPTGVGVVPSGGGGWPSGPRGGSQVFPLPDGVTRAGGTVFFLDEDFHSIKGDFFSRSGDLMTQSAMQETRRRWPQSGGGSKDENGRAGRWKIRAGEGSTTGTGNDLTGMKPLPTPQLHAH